jgi:hypothetical protein
MAEMAIQTWTADTVTRHVSYQRLCDDKPGGVRERPEPSATEDPARMPGQVEHENSASGEVIPYTQDSV